MYRLDLSHSVKDLDGTEIEDSQLAGILANALKIAQDDENARKFYCIAQDLFKNGYRDLDKSDLQKIKDFVSKGKRFPVITQAHLEEAIEACEKNGELNE